MTARAESRRADVASAVSEQEGCCEVHVFAPERVEQVQRALPSGARASEIAQLFKVLSSATRVRILCALDAHELCVCDIAHVLGMSVSAISHQLRKLRDLEIVRTRTEGKLVYYRFDHPLLARMLQQVGDHLAQRDVEEA